VAHDHHHQHDHGVSAETEIRPLAVALALILVFMAAEVALAFVADSLALLSDAAHMLIDAAALGMSVWAARLALRPAAGRMTFGFRRAEILAAQANGITLLLLGALIMVEAVRRLNAPPEVDGPIVVGTAVVGALVNVLALRQVARANRANLNVEGSYRHLLTDLYAFAGTAVAGAVIWATGPLVRRSGQVLLEAAPEGLAPDEITAAMRSHGGVTDVHDLHVWEISSGFPALSAHVLVGRGEDCHGIRRELEAVLHERFGIDHTTLQVEHTADRLLDISRPDR
jgi:cobalt-zinc-cadmium efflux system protein